MTKDKLMNTVRTQYAVRPLEFRRAHFSHDGKFLQFSYWGKTEGGFRGYMYMSEEDVKLAIDDQYTGLKDCKDVRIFENDILYRQSFSDWVVVWYKAGFHVYNICNPACLYPLDDADHFRSVKGNTHENK